MTKEEKKVLRRGLGTCVALLDAAVSGGAEEFGGIDGDRHDEKKVDEAAIALNWLRQVQNALTTGEVLLVTKAELRELQLAFNNSTHDPRWFYDWSKNKSALRSAAQKIGGTVK